MPGPKPDPAPEAQPRPAEKPPLKTFQPRNFPVLACAISPDGKSFATGHGDRCARLWDYESGDLKQTLAGHAKGVRCIAFSPEGALATGSDDKSIRLWDAASGRCTQTLEGHGSYVSAVAFLPDGRLFSASADGTAAIWNLDTGAQETVLRGHLRGIEDACISADGRFAATASWDGTARVWDLVEGKETLCLRLDNDVPLCVAFTPAAEQLAVGTKNGKLLLYEIRSGQVTRSFHKPTDVRSIYRVAFSPDGKTLFRCGGDDELRSIELETGKAVANDAPQKTFRCLAPAPDNKSFAAGTNDGAACVWQIK